MKKLVLIAISLCCAIAFTVSAADAPKKKRDLTPEQQKIQKEMLEKYDANKDGKLDREERAKISTEDKDKLAKAGLAGQRKKSEDKK